MLDDGIEEVDEVVQAGIRPDFFGGGDESDEEEDDAADKEEESLTERELGAMKAAYMVLRLGRLVLNRLVNSSSPALASQSTASSLAAPYTSSAFLGTALSTLQDLTAQSDDLASSLSDFPHDPATISALLEDFIAVVTTLSHLVESESPASTDSPVDALAALSLEASSAVDKGETGIVVATKGSKVVESEKSWQTMFRDQLSKAGKKATASLYGA